jgi:hypothetical protein
MNNDARFVLMPGDIGWAWMSNVCARKQYNQNQNFVFCRMTLPH